MLEIVRVLFLGSAFFPEEVEQALLNRSIQISRINALTGDLKSACKLLNPDVVVLDARNVSDDSELFELSFILRRFCSCSIMFLSKPSNKHCLQLITEVDVDAYIIKKNIDVNICHLVRAVASGEKLLSSAITYFILRRADNYTRAVRSSHGLTAREWDTLMYMNEGLTNNEIASVLHLSEKTVRNYVSQIYTKLNVGNRESAIEWYQGNT